MSCLKEIELGKINAYNNDQSWPTDPRDQTVATLEGCAPNPWGTYRVPAEDDDLVKYHKQG